MSGIMKNIFVILLLSLCAVSCGRRSDAVQAADFSENLKLADYRPVSVFKIPVSDIRSASFPVTDMHSHAYLKNADDIRNWVKLMDENNIERIFVHTGAYGEEFDALYDLYKSISDRFELCCGIDMSSWGTPDFPAKAWQYGVPYARRSADLPMPPSALLHQKEKRRCGRIDQSHLRAAHLTAVVGRQQLGHFNALSRTLGMPGINGNEQTAALFEQFDRGANGGQGRFAQSGNTAVAAGQIPEIEQPRADRLADVIFNVTVRIFDQGHVGAPMFRQSGGGIIQRLLLNIKGIDLAAFADLLGQPQGIVAVAHGKIDNGTALFDMGRDQIFLRIEQIDHCVFLH
mgnify:CR=1 FL=1